MPLLYFTGRIIIFLLLDYTSASDLRGPGSARGLVGRTLSVTCYYDKYYRTYNKYWCKGDDWSDCTIVVITRGSEAEVKAGRTSIKDNYTCCCFTVTLENLMEADAGEYWCAIERTGADIHVPVTVLPEHLPTTTIVVTTGYSSTDQSPTSGLNANIARLLLPIVLLVLVMALLVGGLLVMWRLKKKKVTKAYEHTHLSTASSHAECSVSSATLAASVRPNDKIPSPSSGQDVDSTPRVEYASVKRTPTPPNQPEVPGTNTEDVSYATIRFPAQDENTIYANL